MMQGVQTKLLLGALLRPKIDLLLLLLLFWLYLFLILLFNFCMPVSVCKFSSVCHLLSLCREAL